MARRVHLQDDGPERVSLGLGALSLRHPLAVGREGRVLREHACHVGVAKDLQATPVRVLEDGLGGTHRAIPLVRSVELLFMALCLHLFHLSSLNGLIALFSFSTIQRTKGCSKCLRTQEKIIQSQLILNQIITFLLFHSPPITSTMCMTVRMPFIDELAYSNVRFGTKFTCRRILMSHLKYVRVIAPLTVFLVVLTVLAAARGALVHASPSLTLVPVSSTDPYANCSIAGQPGINFPDAEVEPWVSVNPTKSSNIVGVWQQDRWSNGGARGLVSGYSFDRGKTWKEGTLPFRSCAPGGLSSQRASDPWVSFGPDGTAYTSAITFDGTDRKNAVAAATSTDGRKTWRNLVKLVEFTTNGGQFSTDKNSTTADPVKAGTAYTVWDTLVSPTHNPDDNPHTLAFTGNGFLSTHTDGGQHWSAPLDIVHTSQRTQPIVNPILFDPPTGTRYDFF